MSGSSFYLQIAPYILLEYTYNEVDYISSQVKLARVTNNYYGGQKQFINTSASQNVTNNVLDTSAVNIGGVKWAYLNKDVPVPYTAQDSNIVYDDLSSLFLSLNVTYDRVRLHLLSGYTLDDIDGLIAQVYVKEAQTSNTAIFANNVYLDGDRGETPNPRPIQLGEKLYDRFIEFYVPSLKAVNDDFYADPTNNLSIGYQYSTNTRGFLINGSIYVKVFEIARSETSKGNLFFYTGNFYEAAVSQEDLYSKLTANVNEATDGDYFQYYPTYNGNFVEDFLSLLNAGGGDYVVINDVDVYEQVGSEEILTSTFSQVQVTAFDQPLEFRPVLKYADVAVSFSVDYTARIFNRNDGFQIIRRASTTSFKPRKYGKQRDSISLTQQSYPFKVYNKVVGGPQISVSDSAPTPQFTTVLIPIFFDSKTITAETKTVLADGANPLNPNFGEGSVAFGQGDARIYLSDFESYVKFTMKQMDPVSQTLNPVNLSASKMYISFKDTAGNIIKYPSQEPTQENSLSDGEMVFKIPGDVRNKIGIESGVKAFYILATSEQTESLLYTGSVDIAENVSKETARVQAIKSSSASSNAPVTSAPRTVGATAAPLDLQQSIKTKPLSVSQQLTEQNSSQVKGQTKKDLIQPTDIPGFSNDPKAASIKNGIKPVGVAPETLIKKTLTKNQEETKARQENKPRQ